jgi:hypothetical protein
VFQVDRRSMREVVGSTTASVPNFLSHYRVHATS